MLRLVQEIEEGVERRGGGGLLFEQVGHAGEQGAVPAAGLGDDDGAARGDAGEQPLEVLAGGLADSDEDVARGHDAALVAGILVLGQAEALGEESFALRAEVASPELSEPVCEGLCGAVHAAVLGVVLIALV